MEQEMKGLCKLEKERYAVYLGGKGKHYYTGDWRSALSHLTEDTRHDCGDAHIHPPIELLVPLEML